MTGSSWNFDLIKFSYFTLLDWLTFGYSHDKFLVLLYTFKCPFFQFCDLWLRTVRLEDVHQIDSYALYFSATYATTTVISWHQDFNMISIAKRSVNSYYINSPFANLYNQLFTTLQLMVFSLPNV